MKKLLLLTFLATLSTTALADGYRGGYRGGYHGGGWGGWIAPLAIGGVIGYELNRQPTVIVQQPQYQPLPSYVPAEPVYQYQNIYDANCSCYRQVLVQIN